MTDFVFVSEQGERDKQEDYFANYKNEFFVLCDGLGGHPAGEVAARTATRAALKEYQKARLNNPEEILNQVFEAADKAIFQGFTTMVCLLHRQSQLFFANIGDSRGYVLRKNDFVQITRDHREGPYLTQSLGLGNKLSLDLHRVEAKEALLCTDGLTDFVTDGVIEKILRSNKPLKKKGQGLVEVALQFGSTDNITVGLIEA